MPLFPRENPTPPLNATSSKELPILYQQPNQKKEIVVPEDLKIIQTPHKPMK